LKRVFDFMVGFILLVILLPVMMIIAAVIILIDGAPVIFKQTRIGRQKQTFSCYKFRTMVIGTGDHPSHSVSKSAITKLGGFLRRFKLDELPQLVNVVLGNMSLVGPRPCLPTQELLMKLREQEGIFALLPGVTGYAQVRDIDMSRPEELVECEKIYLIKQTLLLDVQILFATVAGNGLKTDAAQKESKESSK
jgi:O-antigen biosynthesis protein WbqP